MNQQDSQGAFKALERLTGREEMGGNYNLKSKSLDTQ